MIEGAFIVRAGDASMALDGGASEQGQNTPSTLPACAEST